MFLLTRAGELIEMMTINGIGRVSSRVQIHHIYPHIVCILSQIIDTYFMSSFISAFLTMVKRNIHIQVFYHTYYNSFNW